jgi:hypothetical protein
LAAETLPLAAGAPMAVPVSAKGAPAEPALMLTLSNVDVFNCVLLWLVSASPT